MTDEIKKEERNEDQMNEEQLEDVSGGGFFSAPWNYRSGRWPRFHVDEHVKVKKGPNEYHAIITYVSPEPNWAGSFTYTVVYDDGDVETGVYEGQMMYQDGRWQWQPRNGMS